MDEKRGKTIFRGKQALSKKSARGDLNHFSSNYYGLIVASAQFHSNVLFPVKVLPVNTFKICKVKCKKTLQISMDIYPALVLNRRFRIEKKK